MFSQFFIRTAYACMAICCLAQNAYAQSSSSATEFYPSFNLEYKDANGQPLAQQTLQWSLCRSNATTRSENFLGDCGVSGNLTFNHVCGILAEDNWLFVMDSNAVEQNQGKTARDLEVYIYAITLGASPNMALKAKVALPVNDNVNAHCMMGSTTNTLYAATNASTPFAIDLHNFTAQGVGGTGPTVSITSDAAHHYVHIEQYTSIYGNTFFDYSDYGTFVGHTVNGLRFFGNGNLSF